MKRAPSSPPSAPRLSDARRSRGRSRSGAPLAALFGPPRDQVLGLSMIAGNGTLLRVGGRVVKNVAGFDLAKAVIGAHGGFGAIVEVHLRLRARAQADRTAGGT